MRMYSVELFRLETMYKIEGRCGDFRKIGHGRKNGWFRDTGDGLKDAVDLCMFEKFGQGIKIFLC